MEDKLVTLAIHTFEKAQILKTILETEGIEVYIHNVNQIQPVISAGVRVRIKESDLPHALRIIEDNKWMENPEKEEEVRNKLKVVLLHVYFSPYFPTAIPLGDTMAYQINEEESVHHLQERVQADMNDICEYINERMAAGKLPKIKYDYVLREGLPEEEIMAYSKECRPLLIVMGTRGKGRKDADLIGSVTGEVIDVNRVPVLAIPEDVPFNDLRAVKHLAFATSFRQRDLVAFDEFMGLIKGLDVKIHLFNISTSRDEWNEIRLTGVREYFQKQYPDADISYTVLSDGDLLLAVEKFVVEQHIDMIALSTYRRSIWSRMFNPSIARRMLFHTSLPLLVMNAR